MLRVLLPPTLNQSYVVRRFGPMCPLCERKQKAGLMLSKMAAQWKWAVSREAESKFGRLDPKGTYAMRIVQHLSKNSRDADSNVKLAMDSVAIGVGINDNRIFKVELEKVIDGESYLEIDIWPVMQNN